MLPSRRFRFDRLSSLLSIAPMVMLAIFLPGAAPPPGELPFATFASPAFSDTVAGIPGMRAGARPTAAPVPRDGKAAGAWSDRFYCRGDLDGAGTALLVQADGVVASGEFARAAGTLLNHVARWDGTAWRAMGEGIPHAVGAIAEYGGQLYAGAYRWDGASWENVLQTDGTIKAMAVSGDRLIVAGQFTHVRGDSVPFLFAWDGANVSPLGGWPDGPVMALAVRDSQLIAGGKFAVIGSGPAVHNLAVWDGHAWSDFAGGVSGTQTYQNEYGQITTFPPNVRALAWWGDDLVAGGQFTTAGIGQTPARSIARWDGSVWHELPPGVTAYNCGPTDDYGNFNCWPASVWSLLAHDDVLYVAGDFEQVAGIETSGIARWNGSTWLSCGLDGTVWVSAYALALAGDDVLVAGDFPERAWNLSQSGGVSTWAADAWAPVASPPGLGVSERVDALQTYGDDLVVAGYFPIAGDPPISSIVATDGDRFFPLGASGAHGEVEALALFGSDLVAAGAFDLIDGVPAQRVARWNGSTWQPLGEGLDFQVTALAVHDGRLYAGGTTGYVTRPLPRNWKSAGAPVEPPPGPALADEGRLSRWNGASWDSVLTTDRNVLALASYGGELWVGGEFTTVSGQPTSKLFRLDTISGTITSCAVSGGEVRCLTIWNGLLVAGGYFSQVAGEPVAHVAAWNGSQWSVPGRLTAVSGWSAGVWGLHAAGSLLFVLGGFTAVDGMPALGAAMWNGQDWRSFGAGIPDCAFCAAVYRGRLYVGGAFNFAGGVRSENLARWEEEGLPVVFSSFRAERAGRAARLRWELQSSGPVALHVWRESADATGKGAGERVGEVAGERVGEEAGERAGEGAGEPAGDRIRTRLTSTPLQSTGPGEFTDPSAPAGPADYWLEELQSGSGAGSLWHGPAHLAAAPVPRTVRLDQNRPNPFNPRTVLTLALPEPGPVTLAVYDTRGRRLVTLVAENLPAGERAIAWDGRDGRGRLLPSGEYLARLVTAAGSRAIKLTLAR